MSDDDDDDDVANIVLINGSEKVCAGFGGDDAPRAVVPNVVGSPRHKGVMVGMGQKDAYCGDEAISKRGILALKYPVAEGTVQSWDDMERMWHHTFYNELRVAPEEHPVLVGDSYFNSKIQNEKMISMMFETFNVPAFYRADTASLALYCYGSDSGLVVESGVSGTNIVSVAAGSVLSAVKCPHLGGSDVTDYLRKILSERGYAFTTTAERDIVRDIKEKLCYVSSDYEADLRSASEGADGEKNYELPDGQVITIGDERFRAPEFLFRPSILALEGPGLAGSLAQAVQALDAPARSGMLGNIVLAGGNSMLAGLAERLRLEVEREVSPSVRVKVRDQPERKYADWIGGSILSSLSTFQQMWISKQQYDEEGPQIIHRLCTYSAASFGGGRTDPPEPEPEAEPTPELPATTDKKGRNSFTATNEDEEEWLEREREAAESAAAAQAAADDAAAAQTQAQTATATAIDDDMAASISLALQKGRKEWGRSKIMIVGEGRAGKSAFANTIIGRAFTDTESTVGINQMTCDIKFASIGSGSGWAECDRPAKELESAVASMIANGIKPDKEGTDPTAGVAGAVAGGGGGGADPGGLDHIEAFDFRSKLKKADKVRAGKGGRSPGDSAGNAAGGGGGARSGGGDGTGADVGKYMNEAGGEGAEEDAYAELSEQDAKRFDNDFVMKCLADKVQTESKFVISVFDFGGQSVFNVSLLPPLSIYLFILLYLLPPLYI
jgi:actin